MSGVEYSTNIREIVTVGYMIEEHEDHLKRTTIKTYVQNRYELSR